MNAKQCDRCKKLYTYEQLNDLILKEANNNKFYKIEVERIPDIYSNKLDLCPDCYKELIKFIENS